MLPYAFILSCIFGGILLVSYYYDCQNDEKQEKRGCDCKKEKSFCCDKVVEETICCYPQHWHKQEEKCKCGNKEKEYNCKNKEDNWQEYPCGCGDKHKENVYWEEQQNNCYKHDQGKECSKYENKEYNKNGRRCGCCICNFFRNIRF